MAELPLFIGLTGLMYMLGYFMGVYDADRISKKTVTLNHKSRLAIRLLVTLLASAGLCALVGQWNVWLLAALWLYSMCVLNLAFVPTLNTNRIPRKPRFYVSPSNNYDRLLIALFGRYAGQAGYLLNVIVLVGSLVVIWFVY